MADASTPSANDALRGADPRGWVRAGYAVILTGVLGVGLWSALTPLASAIIAPGTVVIDSYRKPVQHLDGGIVREVRVRPGQRVERGDILLVLEDVLQSATAVALRDQLDAELARAARVAAERDRRTSMTVPEELAARAKEDARLAGLLRDEIGVFEAHRKHLLGQVELLRAQIVQTDDELRGLELQIRSAEDGLRYLREERAMNEKLLKEGYVQQTRLLTFDRALADKEEKRGEYIAGAANARQRANELKLRILSLEETFSRDAADQFKASNARILELRERLRPSVDMLERRQVRAPVSGEVVNLKVHGPGAVVTPGDTILDIVPTEDLLAEVRVRPEDIAHVREAADANVELPAFRRRTTPLVRGTVTYVSADALADTVNGTAVQYFMARLVIDRDDLAAAGDLRLSPGMPVVAFIRDRDRTVLDYFVQPITETLRRSMREP